MTPDELDAIRTRDRARTQGKWEHEWYDFGGRVALHGTCSIVQYANDNVDIPIQEQRANIDFITCASTDIPALLAEVDRLRKAIATARAWAQHVSEYHTWDRRSGIWDTANAILIAAGDEPEVCCAVDCHDRDHPCPDVEDLKNGPSV